MHLPLLLLGDSLCSLHCLLHHVVSRCRLLDITTSRYHRHLPCNLLSHAVHVLLPSVLLRRNLLLHLRTRLKQLEWLQAASVVSGDSWFWLPVVVMGPVRTVIAERLLGDVGSAVFLVSHLCGGHRWGAGQRLRYRERILVEMQLPCTYPLLLQSDQILHLGHGRRGLFRSLA